MCIGARRREQRVRSPAFDGEACRDDGALQAGVDGESFEVRQHEPDAERVSCTGWIDNDVCTRRPIVKAIGTRVVQDSAAGTAFENNEA